VVGFKFVCALRRFRETIAKSNKVCVYAVSKGLGVFRNVADVLLGIFTVRRYAARMEGAVLKWKRSRSRRRLVFVIVRPNASPI